MHPRPSSAVYKCIIPVKNKKPVTTPSAIYQSLFREPREGAQVLPFPAWPEIDDAYQPCCLPTLERAVYFHHHPISEEFLDVATRVVGYWNHGVEREISQQINVLIKTNSLVFWPRRELSGLPPVILGAEPANTAKLYGQLIKSTEHMIEAIAQGVIYGHLNIFFGAPRGDFLDVFAYVHELSHHFAGRLHGGYILGELSKSNHKTLHILATEEWLSCGEIAKLWREFWHTNAQLMTLTAKFEPIEEISATYLGLRFLPTDVRHTVKPMIDEELRKRNWDKAYKAFAEACDNDPYEHPIVAAMFIADCVCRFVESIDIDSAYLLYEFSNISKRILEGKDNVGSEVLLTRAGVPAEIQRAVFKAYKNFSSEDGLTERLLQSYLLGPSVWLIGRYSENIIHPTVYECFYESSYKDNLSLRARIFYESIRQQLSKRCGFVSPFPHTQETSEFKEEIQRLYMRLPEDIKNTLT